MQERRRPGPLRSALTVAALWLAFGAFGPAARAEGDAAPKKSVDQATAEVDEALDDAREELSEYQPDWNQRPKGSFEFAWDIIGIGESRTRAVLSTGWGFSVTPWIPEEVPGLRFLNFNGMIMTGDFGDTQYDAFHLQLGHDPRFGVFEVTGLEVLLGPRFRYTLTGAGQDDFTGPHVLVDRSRPYALRHSASFGGGVDFRLLEGALTVGLSGEAAYAITEPFLGDPIEDVERWKPRAGLTLKTDLCFQLGTGNRDCYHQPTRQENVDLSVVLRRALALAASCQADQKLLCEAATEGVRITRSSEGCQGYEADGFFCRTHNALPEGSSFRPKIAAVWSAHRELERCYADQREREHDARRHDRKRAIRLQYGAYASEMRRALRCDPSQALITPDEPDEIERQNEAIIRACELCPRACPEGAPWKPKD